MTNMEIWRTKETVNIYWEGAAAAFFYHKGPLGVKRLPKANGHKLQTVAGSCVFARHERRAWSERGSETQRCQELGFSGEGGGGGLLLRTAARWRLLKVKMVDPAMRRCYRKASVIWDWRIRNTSNISPRLWFEAGSVSSVLKDSLFPRGSDV